MRLSLLASFSPRQPAHSRPTSLSRARSADYGGKDIGPSQQDLAVPVTTWKQFVQQQKWDGIV